MRSSPRLLVTLLVATTLLAAGANAETVGVGGQVPAISLEDQHGVTRSVEPGTRIIVLSRDMAAGDIVKGGLAGMDQGALDLRGAVYVADISGMPAMVARMFAVPKMRERSYRILLDRDGAATRDLPYSEGKPTVIFVESGKIARIAQPATGDELRASLQP